MTVITDAHRKYVKRMIRTELDALQRQRTVLKNNVDSFDPAQYSDDQIRSNFQTATEYKAVIDAQFQNCKDQITLLQTFRDWLDEQVLT